MSIRKILSYCKSHIYDLHSLLVGTIIFFLVIIWKDHIDAFFESIVDKRYADCTEEEKKLVVKRLWGLVYILIIPLAFLVYAAAATISPLVNQSVPASVISASFAIVELEFYKTYIQKKR